MYVNIFKNIKQMKLKYKIIIFFAIAYTFTTLYRFIGHETFDGLDETSTIFDYFYHSVVIQTTLGLGDIVPITTVSRILTLVQTTLAFILIGL